jgi:hypothetical protein
MIDAGEDEVNRDRRSTATDGSPRRGSGRKHHTCHKHRKRSKSHRRKRKSREDRDLEAGRGERREGSFDRAREGDEDGEWSPGKAGQLTPKHIFYNYSTDVTWEAHEESLEGGKWSMRAKKAALKFAVGHKVELAIAALCLFVLFLLRISGAHPTWLCCALRAPRTDARTQHTTHTRTRTTYDTHTTRHGTTRMMHMHVCSVAGAEVARVVHGLRGLRCLLHVGQECGAQRRGDGVRHHAPPHTRHHHPQ